MKSYKFGNTQLNLKPDLISKLIDTSIICREFTHKDIIENAGTTSSAANKLLSALNECKFTYLKNDRLSKARDRIHTFSDTLSVLVIDLSMPQYSMSITRGHSGCQFYKTYSYNPLLSLYENVFSFLSAEAEQVKKQSFGIAAICVIYADNKDRDLSAFSSLSGQLPYEADLAKIDSIIASIYGFLPTLQLKNSQAIENALKYRLINENIKDNSTTYIYIGASISVAHFPMRGDPIICDVKNLLINQRETVSDMFCRHISSEGLGSILYRILNFTHCAYSSEQYIIEYDSLKFDARTLKELKKAFVICGDSLPEIIASSHSPGITHLGATAATFSEIIKKHITTIF